MKRVHAAPAIVALLVLAHLAWIPLSLPPVFPDFDAAGYVTAARVIATHGEGTMPRQSWTQFVGVHWFPAEGGGYVSRYPPGFPLLLASLWYAGGMKAALAANPLLLSVALCLLFALCRQYVQADVALLCVVLLAVNTLANRQAFHVDSHPAAMVCVLAIVVILDRWRKKPRLAVAVVGGLLMGILPTVRYAEVVCWLGVAVFFALSARRTPNVGWHVVGVACGMALPIAALLHRNGLLFGSWWRTGYAISQEQSAFSVANLTQNIGPYLSELWQVLLLALPLGVIGVALLCRSRESRPIGMLLAATAVLFLVVYASYYWRQSFFDSEPIRFLLPAIPLLLFATAIALERVRTSHPIIGSMLMVLLAAQSVLQFVHSRERIASAADWSAPGLEVERMLERYAPAGSIIVADLLVATSLESMGRWRLADGDLLAGLCDSPVALDGPMSRPLVGRESMAARIDQGLDCEARRQRAVQELKAWAGDDGRVYLVTWERRRNNTPGEWTAVGTITVPPWQLVPPTVNNKPRALTVLQLVR